MRQSPGAASEKGRPTAARAAAFGVGATAVSAAALGQTIRFGDPAVYATGDTILSIPPADINGDGAQDVMVLADDGIRVYLNDGRGALSLEAMVPVGFDPRYLVAADMDLDFDQDLVWFDWLPDFMRVMSVWYNDGDGRSGEAIHTVFSGYEYVTPRVADINGDDKPDVLFGSAPRTISAFINADGRSFELNEVFTFSQSRYDLEAIVPGDFDGDGDTDITAAFQYVYEGRFKDVEGTAITLLLNDGGVPLRLQHNLELPWQSRDLFAFDMAAGDLDGDGDLDVAVGGSNYLNGIDTEVALLENDSGGSLLLAGAQHTADGSRGDLSVADIDTDGRLDLILVTGEVRGVYVMRNGGRFVFEGRSPFYSSVEGTRVEVADVSGDGQIDLIHAGSREYAVLFNETLLRGPSLEVSRLVRNGLARFIVRRAQPNENVYFLYGVSGIGSTRGYHQLGGLTLDLNRPNVFGVAVADEGGRAVLQRHVPPDAPLIPVGVQAVVRRGRAGGDSVKTPFQVRLIED